MEKRGRMKGGVRRSRGGREGREGGGGMGKGKGERRGKKKKGRRREGRAFFASVKIKSWVQPCVVMLYVE